MLEAENNCKMIYFSVKYLLALFVNCQYYWTFLHRFLPNDWHKNYLYSQLSLLEAQTLSNNLMIQGKIRDLRDNKVELLHFYPSYHLHSASLHVEQNIATTPTTLTTF